MLRVVLRVKDLVAVLIGIVDGKEVQAEVTLSKEELERLQAGEKLTVELKDGHKERVKPTVEK